MEQELIARAPRAQCTRERRTGTRAEGTAKALHWLVALLLLLSLVAAPTWADDEAQAGTAQEEVAELVLDEELLAQLSTEAMAAVSEHTGVSLEGLEMRVAKRSELRKVLRAELEPQFAAMFEDPDLAEVQLAQAAAFYSRSLFAKYAHETDEVLISERNFNDLARIMEQPRVRSREMARVVLVHEAVHAADERSYAFSATLKTLGSRDEISAFSSVIEGHAQFVTRQIAAKHGWSADFDFFTDMIDESPETGEAAIDYTSDVLVAMVAAAYYDGETFIAHLAEHGGPEAIARAFREPPAETILIEEPGWYLDPSTRPALVHDFEPVLQAFAAARDAEAAWATQELALTNTQMHAAFSLLPKEEVDAVVKQVRQAQMLVQVATDAPPGSVMVAVGLFEASSAEGARSLLELENSLMHKKDEVMSRGQVKIRDAVYRDVERGPISGTFSSKVVDAAGQELLAKSVVLRRDLVVLEVSYVGDRWTEDEALEQGLALLEAAHLSRRAVEAEPGEQEAEEEEK